MSNEQTRSNREGVPLSWFGETLWKFTPLYFELIFLAICIRLLGLVEPFIFQVVIDRVLPFQREATLFVVMLIFVMVSAFHVVFNVLSTLLGVQTGNMITRELGRRIFLHLFRLPLSHFRKWPTGQTIARISEIDTIRNFLVGTSTGVLLDLLFVTIYLAILFALSPLLMFIVLLSLPIQAVVYLLFGPFLRRKLSVQFDTGAKHQTRMVESISGISAVKALSAENKMLSGLDETLAANLSASYKVEKLYVGSENLTYAVNQSLTILIIFVGSSEVFSGNLTLGQLIAFYLIAGKTSSPINNFSSLWEQWQNIKVSRQRLGDILLSHTEPFEKLPKLPRDVNPELTFENVSFEYDDGFPVLSSFSFRADANTLSIVIGPSGVGKSTFGRIAAGIETPTRGSVLLGSNDISHFDPNDIRTKIAYVPQEPFLFSGTIRENLLLNSVERSEAQISEVLRVATAEHMINEFPLGLDTQVGERGSALSGGQRQRIAIARSLLNEPKVLVMDEPTSALDPVTQFQLVEHLSTLKSNMTIIVITHRPDVFENFDQIIDFEKLL